jgi:hypothetical protein
MRLEPALLAHLVLPRAHSSASKLEAQRRPPRLSPKSNPGEHARDLPHGVDPQNEDELPSAYARRDVVIAMLPGLADPPR